MFIENKEKIDKVVLIAGDGIYTGFTRLASSIVDKIEVVFWKDSLSEKLKKVSRRKVTVRFIEDLFNLEEKKAEEMFGG